MSSQESGPLFPDDILRDPQGADSVRSDIDHTFSQVSRNTQISIEESQLAIRAASFGVLASLEEHGVSEAIILREMLEAKDPEQEPLAADLADIVLELSEAQYATDDREEQRRLKTLASIGHAVNAIAIAKAVAMYNFDWNTAALLEGAETEVAKAYVDESTREALQQALAGAH